jgi:hypothetical protein
MNMVNRTARITRRHVPLAGLTTSVRLPVYMGLSLPVAAVIAVVVVGWTIALRHSLQPSSPFSDYAEILPGRPGSGLSTLRFSCTPDYSDYTHVQYCTRAPATGPFYLVAVTVPDGVVSRVNFAVRPGALTIGDLVLLWGRPSIRLYRKSAVFGWPRLGVYASGWAESQRFSYTVPVLRLSIGKPWL